MGNELSREHSPYLLQHAGQPVDWLPWSDEAFSRAEREDKPVFLSIGYSTCHWCHVMSRESFENPRVAALLNETFICVKVDREELPAVDSYYMAVSHIFTGGGGWPLTILMTPAKIPFYAATYLPRESRGGTIGMVDLIPQIAAIWKTKRDEVDDIAEQIRKSLARLEERKPGDIGSAILDQAYRELSHRYDAEFGGFDSPAKFPSAHNLIFLLRFWKRTGTLFALEMVESTLAAMRSGGLFDQLGYGFHRYSTDQRWILPHFEKMLADQAVTALACIEAYHAAGNPAFRETAEKVFTYVLRDLRDADGGFFTAEDADSEGAEGKFYLWTEREIMDSLPPEDAELAVRAFSVDPGGNFEEEATGQRNGLNVLHLDSRYDSLPVEYGLTPEDFASRMESIRERLVEIRNRRTRPARDEKILTGENGLMIAALAYGGRVFENPGYVSAAEKTAGWILGAMRDDSGMLRHRYFKGDAGIPGGLADYSFLVWGLVELYEATYNAAWLRDAQSLAEHMLEQFWDLTGGGFFSTPVLDHSLPIRRKETFDSAIPSGYSAAVLNLIRLARLTGRPEFEEKAWQALRAVSEPVNGAPSAHSLLMTAIDLLTNESAEVIISGKTGAADTDALIRALNHAYLPWTVSLFHPVETTSPLIEQVAPFLKSYGERDGAAAAYICRNSTCSEPVTEPGQMIERLKT